MTNTFLTKLFSPENIFFKGAEKAKRLPHIAFSSVLLPLLFILFGILLYQLVFIPLTIGDISNVSYLSRKVLMLAVGFAMIICGVALWVHFVEKRPFQTMGLSKEQALKNYVLGFGTGFFMMTAIVGIMALSGSIKLDTSGSYETGVSASGAVLLMLAGFIIQGGAEEIVNRGWQFQVIGVRYKPWIGAVISSILFAVLHSFNNSVSILAVFNLFIFASLLVLFVMNDGNIWRACGWHTAWNWTMGNVFGLEVSGNDIEATLIDLKTAGPDIITGGGFGPEGSIITTIVLAAAVFITAKSLLNKTQ